MMKQKSHRSIPTSCKRLFHKLGLAVALSTISGCPSVPTTVNYVERKPLTRQEEVIFNQTDLFRDCYCAEKQRRLNIDDGCLDLDEYIVPPVGFSARAIMGYAPLPETKLELDQSIVDFCVSKLSKPKDMNLSSASKISDKK